MSTEIITAKSKYDLELKQPALMLHENEHLELKAKVALSMLEKWGMVAAEPDGEDSAGRAKLKLPSADDLAKRACDVTDEAFTEFEKRGWVLKLPTMSEMKEKYAEKEKVSA